MPDAPSRIWVEWVPRRDQPGSSMWVSTEDDGDGIRMTPFVLASECAERERAAREAMEAMAADRDRMLDALQWCAYVLGYAPVFSSDESLDPHVAYDAVDTLLQDHGRYVPSSLDEIGGPS